MLEFFFVYLYTPTVAVWSHPNPKEAFWREVSHHISDYGLDYDRFNPARAYLSSFDPEYYGQNPNDAFSFVVFKFTLCRDVLKRCMTKHAQNKATRTVICAPIVPQKDVPSEVAFYRRHEGKLIHLGVKVLVPPKL